MNLTGYNQTGFKLKPFTTAEINAINYTSITALDALTKNIPHLNLLYSTLPRTQKAKGIRLLTEGCGINSFEGPTLQHLLKHTFLYQSKEEILLRSPILFMRPWEMYPDDQIKWFARPCPTKPQHGFVDSQVVKSTEELADLYDKAYAEDNGAEILVMPMIDAKYSAILAGQLYSIGLGNDSATSGNDAINFPISRSIYYTDTFKKMAGIDSEVYHEMVYTNGSKPILVQLRDGPKVLTGVMDYIPHDMGNIQEIVVTNVTEDLLTWKLKVQKLVNQRNVVVYFKDASLVCHQAVQCIIHGIPFITSFEPKLGQNLVKNVDSSVQGLSSLDLEQVSKGIEKAFGYGYELKIQNTGEYDLCDEGKKVVINALYCLHNISVLNKQQSEYVGCSLGLLTRYCLAACFGEARHHDGLKGLEKPKSRENVYFRSLLDFQKTLNDASMIKLLFSKGGWSHGYGGKKWARCLQNSIKLANCLIQASKHKRFSALQKAFEQTNIVINIAHNNGKFLNKFVGSTAFFNAANYPPEFVITQGPSLYKQAQMVRDLKLSTRRAKLKLGRLTANQAERDKFILIQKVANGYLSLCDSCGIVVESDNTHKC
jgi:hypothetical protein